MVLADVLQASVSGMASMLLISTPRQAFDYPRQDVQPGRD